MVLSLSYGSHRREGGFLSIVPVPSSPILVRGKGRAQRVVVAVGALTGTAAHSVVVIIVVVVVMISVKDIQQSQELTVAALISLIRPSYRPRGLRSRETLCEKSIQTLTARVCLVVVGLAVLEAGAEGDVWLYGRSKALRTVAHVGKKVLVKPVGG